MQSAPSWFSSVPHPAPPGVRCPSAQGCNKRVPADLATQPNTKPRCLAHELLRFVMGFSTHVPNVSRPVGILPPLLIPQQNGRRIIGEPRPGLTKQPPVNDLKCSVIIVALFGIAAYELPGEEVAFA